MTVSTPPLRPRERLRTRLRHVVRGLGYGYPVCCVLAFVLDPRPGSAKRRGIVDLGVRENGANHCWVPCRYHQRHPAWRPLRGVS